MYLDLNRNEFNSVFIYNINIKMSSLCCFRPKHNSIVIGVPVPGPKPLPEPLPEPLPGPVPRSLPEVPLFQKQLDNIFSGLSVYYPQNLIMLVKWMNECDVLYIQNDPVKVFYNKLAHNDKLKTVNLFHDIIVLVNEKNDVVIKKVVYSYLRGCIERILCYELDLQVVIQLSFIIKHVYDENNLSLSIIYQYFIKNKSELRLDKITVWGYLLLDCLSIIKYKFGYETDEITPIYEYVAFNLDTCQYKDERVKMAKSICGLLLWSTPMYFDYISKNNKYMDQLCKLKPIFQDILESLHDTHFLKQDMKQLLMLITNDSTQ